MVSNTLLTFIALPIIFTTIFLLGRYISKSQEIFESNQAAVFMTGAVTYFFIAFVVLFPFVWLDVGITYFVIVFMLKEAVLYIFLILKWQGKISFRTWTKFGVSIVGGVVIAVVYQFWIIKIIKIGSISGSGHFQTWEKVGEIFQSLFKMDSSFATDWFMTIIVSVIALVSIVAFVGEVVGWKKMWIESFSFLVTLIIITLFSFGVELYLLLGVFIIIFMIVLSIRLVRFSRRRYGALYGISTIALYSSSQFLLISVVILSTTTMIIYTVLKKPKNSLFWVQLVAPAGIISSLTIYDFSAILSLFVFSLALLMYTFILATGRTEFMVKVNNFFSAARYVIPIGIFATLIAISTIIHITSSDDFSILTRTNSYVYSSFSEGQIENIIQQSIYYSLIAIGFVSITIMLIRGKKLRGPLSILIAWIILILFFYNPFVWIIYETMDIQQSFMYIKSIVFVPILIIVPIFIKIKDKNTEQF